MATHRHAESNSKYYTIWKVARRLVVRRNDAFFLSNGTFIAEVSDLQDVIAAIKEDSRGSTVGLGPWR